MSDLTTLCLADFSAHVGNDFRLRAENGECQLKLKEARDSQRYSRNGQTRPPFSLIFSGPAGISFQQGTYTLDHDELGELHIFLVPVGIEQDSVQLEAVFN
ncbi:MAG TPA: hypothetical protein VFF26_12505 [Gallionella sp.]|nr:hypothetical protein [Gallionella sp.]